MLVLTSAAVAEPPRMPRPPQAQTPTQPPTPTAPVADKLIDRFAISLPVEVTLVGLTIGIRPDVLFRFGCPGSRSRIRFAVGLLTGRDQLFLPISLGYRAVFRNAELVQPSVGIGLEQQRRFVSDFATVVQSGFYVEANVGFALSPKFKIGFGTSLDLMLVGGPGAGLGLNMFTSVRL